MRYSIASAARAAAFIVVAGGLSACSGVIGPGPAGQIYMLDPHLPQAQSAPKVEWQLAVSTPGAPQGLDTDRIALSRAPLTMDYYANSVWVDRAPVLLQSLMIRGFEQSGKIDAVAPDDGRIRVDYVLNTDLQSFQAVYDTPNGAPHAVVAIGAQLTSVPDRKVVGTLTARADVAAGANAMPAIIDAFNRATGQAVDKLVTWTLSTPPPEDPNAGQPPRRHFGRRGHRYGSGRDRH